MCHTSCRGGSCVISRQLCPTVLLLTSKIRALVLRSLTDLGSWLVIRALQIRLKFYFVILRESFFFLFSDDSDVQLALLLYFTDDFDT